MRTAVPTADAAPLDYRQLRRLGRAMPRRLRFTREGKLLFFVTLGVGFGAINSGNNLLYLVLGILLSLIMISGVLSELTIRGTTAVRHPAPHLFAGTPALVRVDLANTKRRFTTFSVEVTELVAPTYGLEQRRGLILSIPAGEARTAHVRVEGARRGVVPTAGLRVTTRFPFGFFEKSRIIPLPMHYLVFPRVRPLEVPALRPLVLGTEDELARLGQGDEYYGLRDARAGDDARDIAWKVSARRDKVVVREYQRPAARRVVLVVPNVVPAGVEGAAERLEAAISHAASLATALVEAGYAVGLATADGGVRPDAGRETLVDLYEHLARLPLRAVDPGTRLPLFDDYPRRNVERVAVVTSDLGAAGLAVEAERTVVVDADEERPARHPGRAARAAEEAAA